MADRYQNRPFPAHDDKGESDPLAELARLIGQTDPFGSMGRANPKVQPRSAPPVDPYQHQPAAGPEDSPPAGPPPWMQRANRPEIRKPVYEEPEPEQDYQPAAVHPLHRYAAQHQQQVAPQQDYQEEPYAETEGEVDPSRYDEALYGQIESGAEDYQRDPAYPDDPYAYQDGYEDGGSDQVERRRGGVVMVAAVLALAVIGTGAAFAYRSYVNSPRSGDPPIIRADNSPTKVVPSPADSSNKTADRMPAGDGTEKIVPREEAPVDINARAAAASGPRVVFPPLNQNGNPPSPASVAPSNMPIASAGPAPSNGTLPNNEPHKIKTFSVRGDQGDAGAPAAAAAPPSPAKPAPAPKTAATRSAPSSATANANANAPLSLSPEAAPASADAKTRVATANPVQTAPPPAASSGGGYVVQVSSQRSEADAQASFKALQSKFPTVLGSQSPLIKRADLGDKGVYYRAMVGPFGSSEEASQFCGNLKSAGGQCVIQRN